MVCCCKLLKKKQFCFPLNIPAPDQGYIRGPNGNYFHVVNQMVSWTTAKAHCEAKNGSLAILNSPDLVRFSIDFLDDTRVWIGATDEQEEGNWMWMNGQKVQHPPEYRIDFNDKSAIQNCLSIVEGDLLDHFCHKPVPQIKAFLCEFERFCSTHD